MYSKHLRNIVLIIISPLFFLACEVKEEISASQRAYMLPVTFQQWSEKLNQLNSNIVVVDMWAMWRASCLERFPEMVKLHNKYLGRNVKVLSLNMDDREDLQSIKRAEEFLTKMNASFEHYRIDENMLDVFEEFNLISIPAVIIYDKGGKEKYRLTGDNPNKQFTEKDVESAILTLLQ